MSDVVQVDYDALRSAANGFKSSSTMLKAVLVVVVGVIMVLRSQAFISLFSARLADQFENQIKPTMERLIATLDEMGDDLLLVIKDFDEKDTTGASGFQN